MLADLMRMVTSFGEPRALSVPRDVIFKSSPLVAASFA
jgi:hypothetical protein